MGCLSMRAVVHCSAGTVLLLSILPLAVGCPSSFQASSKDSGSGTTEGGDSARRSAADFADVADGAEGGQWTQHPSPFDGGPRPNDAVLCNDALPVSDKPEWMVELIPFDPDRPRPWLTYPLLIMDGAGNPIVIFSVGDLVPPGIDEVSTEVHKFDPNGQSVWSWTASDPFGTWSATVDKNDNIIIGGTDANGGPGLVKLDCSGRQRWSTTIDDPSDGFMDLATDDQADILGMLNNDTGSSSYFWCASDPRFERFDADGTHRASEQITMTGACLNEEALSFGAIGGVGRYLVAGATLNGDPRQPYMVLLDSDLAEVWDAPLTYGSGEPVVGFVQALPIAGGDIIAVGASRVGDEDEYTFWLQRFGPDGTPRWSEMKPIRGDTSFLYRGYLGTRIPRFPMAVDSQGNVYLALQDAEPIERRTHMLIDKYGPDGSLSWERPLSFDSGTTTDREYAVGVAVDDNGAIYVLRTRLLVMGPRVPMAGMSGGRPFGWWFGLWLHKLQPPE